MEKSPKCLNELLDLSPKHLDHCDGALMNLLCAEGLRGAENLNVADCLATLDHWARRAEAETRRHAYRFRKNPDEFDRSEAKFRMLMLGVVLQSDFGIRYNPQRITAVGSFEPNRVFFADAQDVFLHGLLGQRRAGTCSSLPILYLAVGRRLGYPLKLVATQAHLFLRWESPTERFNIEASGRGVDWHDDAYYKSWPFPVSEQEIAACGFLKSMTAVEELASFLSLRGQCLMSMGRAEEAVKTHERALRLQPESLVYQSILADARVEWAVKQQSSGGGGRYKSGLPLQPSAFDPVIREIELLNRRRRAGVAAPIPNPFGSVHPAVRLGPTINTPNPHPQQGGP